MPYTHEVASSNLATPTNSTGSISIGRLRALGACGCRFESCLPDEWRVAISGDHPDLKSGAAFTGRVRFLCSPQINEKTPTMVSWGGL